MSKNWKYASRNSFGSRFAFDLRTCQVRYVWISPKLVESTSAFMPFMKSGIPTFSVWMGGRPVSLNNWFHAIDGASEFSWSTVILW